ncbi:MAG: single-stranded DNA-binding protein [Nitrospirae bacterium]|nr:MAG: single-stranded DNA-binding protein [Nitrospirota bacterium]
MYNKVIFAGNLTRDPELRYTPQGTAVTNITLAVNSRVKQGEEFKDETLFIDIVVFGKQAENVAQYLSKGRGVIVDGRLRERRWEYEGQQKRKMEVIANTVRFLPRREETPAPPDDDFIPPEESTELEPF